MWACFTIPIWWGASASDSASLKCCHDRNCFLLHFICNWIHSILLDLSSFASCIHIVNTPLSQCNGAPCPMLLIIFFIQTHFSGLIGFHSGCRNKCKAMYRLKSTFCVVCVVVLFLFNKIWTNMNTNEELYTAVAASQTDLYSTCVWHCHRGNMFGLFFCGNLVWHWSGQRVSGSLYSLI